MSHSSLKGYHLVNSWQAGFDRFEPTKDKSLNLFLIPVCLLIGIIFSCSVMNF